MPLISPLMPVPQLQKLGITGHGICFGYMFDIVPRAGSGVVRIDPPPFSGRMSYKATKPGLALSIVYLSMFHCIVVY